MARALFSFIPETFSEEKIEALVKDLSSRPQVSRGLNHTDTYCQCGKLVGLAHSHHFSMSCLLAVGQVEPSLQSGEDESLDPGADCPVWATFLLCGPGPGMCESKQLDDVGTKIVWNRQA